MVLNDNQQEAVKVNYTLSHHNPSMTVFKISLQASDDKMIVINNLFPLNRTQRSSDNNNYIKKTQY